MIRNLDEGRIMNSSLRKAIASLEIAAGLSFPLALIYRPFNGEGSSTDFMMAAGLVAMSLLTLFAGVMLWRNTWTGYILSTGIQLLQLPKLQAAWLGFMFSFGVDIMVMMMTHPITQRQELAFYGQFGQSYKFHLKHPPESPLGCGVSIISCVALPLLLRGKRPEFQHDRLPTKVDPVSQQHNATT